MDKIGFKFGCKIDNLLSFPTWIPLRMFDLDNHDYITLVEFINHTGEIISLKLLILEIKILHKWCIYNNLDNKTLIRNINICYSNDHKAFE